MSLRRKTILSSGVAFFVCIAGLAVTVRPLVERLRSRSETQAIEQTLHQTTALLEQTWQQLDRQAQVWGQLHSQDPGTTATLVTPELIRIQGLGALAFWDPASQSLTLTTQDRDPQFTASLAAVLQAPPNLVTFRSADQPSRGGVTTIGSQVWILLARPYRSQTHPLGVVIAGIPLDSAFVEEVGQRLGGDVVINPELGLDPAATLPRDPASGPTWLTVVIPDQHRDPDTLVGYMRLHHWQGDPRITLQVTIPSPLGYLLPLQKRLELLIFGGGLLLGVVFILSLDYWVLRRLSRLSQEVQKLDPQQPQVRIALPGQDEISQLATVINGIWQRFLQDRQALQESEQQLRTLFSKAVHGIFLLSPTGLIRDCNPAAAQFLGCEPKAIIGSRFWSYLAGQENADDLQAITTQPDLLHEEVYSEKEFRHCDGRRLWGKVGIAAVDRGHEAYFVVMVADITDRKLTEQVLQRSEARNRAIVQAIPDAMFRVRRDGFIMELVNTPADFQGVLNLESLRGRYTHEIVPAAVAEQSLAMFAEALASQSIRVYDYDLGQGQNSRHYETRVVPYQGEEVLLLVRDATETHQAKQRVQAEREFLCQILDANPNVIMVKNAQMKPILMNKAARTFFYGTHTPEESRTLFAGQFLPTRPEQIRAEEWEAYNAQNRHVLETGADVVVPPTPEQDYKGEERILTWVKRRLELPGSPDPILLMVGTDVTASQRLQAEREQAVEELERQDYWLRLALKAAQMGTWQWDVLTNSESWSPETRSLYGFDSDQPITYEHFMAIVHPEDRHVIEMSQRRCLEEGVPHYAEYRVITATGEIRWFVSQGDFIRDPQGRPLTMTGISQDITERKRSEETLRQREHWLRLALQAAKMGIWQRALQTQEQYWSPEEYALHGIPLGTPVDLALFLSVIEPDDRERVLGVIRRGDATLESNQMEYRVRHPDGSLHWLTSRSSYIFDDQGRALSVAGITMDVTERKLAEAERQQREQWLRLALESSNMGAWQWNMQTGEEYWSPETYALHGIATDQAPSYDLFLQVIHPEDRERVIAAQTAAIANHTLYLQEYRVILADQGLRWIESRGTVVYDTAGDPVTMIGIGQDITQRKATEAELKQRELFLRMALEAARMGTWVWDMRTNQQWWSPENRALQGMGPELAATYENFLARVYPPDLPHIQAQQTLALATKTLYQSEYRVIFPNGDVRWLASLGQYFFDDQGQPIRLTGITQDITERKHFEETLRRNEAKYRELVQASGSAIIRWNTQQTITFINDYGLKLFGYQESEIVGQPMVGTILPTVMRNGQPAHELLQEVLRRPERFYSHENENMRRYGERIWMSWSNRPIYNDQGQIEEILSVGVDATERKRMETALKQQLQRTVLLGQITRQIRSSLDKAEIFEVAAQQLGHILHVSHCRVLTYHRDPEPCLRTVAVCISGELVSAERYPDLPIGKEVAGILSQDQALVARNLAGTAALPHTFDPTTPIQSLLGVRTSYQNQPNGAILVYEQAGQRQWTNWEVELLESLAAQVGIALAQVRLLEQERDQNRALEEAKEAAEAANRAKSTFLASMSHELRTPLNAILGFSQLLARDPALPSPLSKSVNTINRSGEHLLNLINDVLEVSKIEAGRMELREEAFHLPKLLDNLREIMLGRARGKQLDLVFDLDPDLPRFVQADQVKLRQIILNLLSNAIKFTQEGEVRLTARAVAHEEGWLMDFVVRDTGAGIAPEELSKLFQPFVQTAAGQRSQEGTGLGLTLCRQYVRLMGGEIRVESHLGSGSAFSFRVPMQPALLSEEDEGSLLPILSLAPGQPSYRILITDDKPDNCELLTQLLQRVGFETQIAYNGQEAVHLWETWQPHLIWMDMRMPIMDGYTATRVIKAQPQGQQVKILALTASAFEEQRSLILEAGCDDFIRKPFRQELIFQKLVEHLGVTFIRETPTPPPLATQAREPQDLQALVQNLDPRWRQDLKQAAAAADAEWILHLLEPIRADYPDLATSLEGWIQDFRFDQVAALLPD